MNAAIVVHEAEEGGFPAEVPVLPGCASQHETIAGLCSNCRAPPHVCKPAASRRRSPGKSRARK